MLKIQLFILICCVFLNDLEAQHNCKENYFNTSKRVEKLKPLYKFMALQSGDTIASIGAGNGWFEAAASVHQDSLTFYLEDLTGECFENMALEKTLAVYSKIKNRRIDNRFITNIGTDSSTMLPSKMFKKVLINNVFHHFSKKKQMLEDIKRITQTGAFIYVFEPIIFPNETKKFKCAYYTSTTTLIEAFENAGFKYVSNYEFHNGSYFFKFVNKE